MKKYFIIPGFAFFLLSLAACDGHSSDAESSDSASEERFVPTAQDPGAPVDNSSASSPSSSDQRTSDSATENDADQTHDHMRPGPGMDTLTKNKKNNGDSRRMIIEPLSIPAFLKP